MQQPTIKDFISFFKKPNYESFDLSFPQKLKEFLKLYLITLVLVFFTRLLVELFILLNVFAEYSQKISKLPDITSKKNSYVFLVTAMVLVPVFEEIVFRLLLTKYNKRFITISLSLIIGSFLTKGFPGYLLNIKSIYIYNLMSFAYPICFALPFFVIANRIKFDFKLIWDRYYPVIFYFITIIFALTHISTLTISNEHYLFLPILILPFIVLGIALGYIRTRLGILYAIFFHFLFNLPMLIRIIIRISES